FALPWLSNTGARFIMLGVPFAAMALAIALDMLPRPVMWSAIALQFVACFPALIDAYEPFWGFRLHEFPLSVAVGLQPADDYLNNHSDDYKTARMLGRDTPPGARVLALQSVAIAYTTRDVRVPWQSAGADRLLDTLRVAGMYGGDPFYDVTAHWPAQLLRAVRVRRPQSYAAEWCVHELEAFSGGNHGPARPHWTLDPWPQSAEAPFA